MNVYGRFLLLILYLCILLYLVIYCYLQGTSTSTLFVSKETITENLSSMKNSIVMNEKARRKKLNSNSVNLHPFFLS